MPGYDENDDEDRDEYDDAADYEDDDGGSSGCVLGDACLVADPFHRSDECFDLEWAEWYYGQAEQTDTELERR